MDNDQDSNQDPSREHNPDQDRNAEGNRPEQPQQQYWQQQPGGPYQSAQYYYPSTPIPPRPTPEPEPKESPEKIWGGEIKAGRGLLGIIPRLLRSREEVFADIRDNKTGASDTLGMVLVSLACFIIYGAVMGLYNPRFFPLQCIYGGLKLPLVFLGTLVVCLPALYIVNVFVGLRMRFMQIVNMFMTAVAVTSIVAVCLAPISGFFLLTVKGMSRYQMLFLINVAILGLSGLAGLLYLGRAMSFMGRHYEKRVGIRFRGKNVLRLWMLIYIFVGVQLAWELRPYMVKEFTIEPGQSLEFVRGGDYDFYSMFLRNLGQQLGAVRSDAEELEYRVEMSQMRLDEALERKEQLEGEQAAAHGGVGTQGRQRELERLDEDIERLQKELDEAKEALARYEKRREKQRNE